MEVCCECGLAVKLKRSLRRHMLKQHPETTSRIEKNRALLCPGCEFSCNSNEVFDQHLLNIHDFEVNTENREFQTEAEFTLWKRSIEESSPVKFVIRSTKRSSNKRTSYYRCNRAGAPRIKVSDENRKREIKCQGSRKINAHCPAKITASVAGDGSVSVVYCLSHFGHELHAAHVPIPSSVKDSIAAQVANNVPFDVIIGVQHSLPGELKREHLITSQDLRNIVREYGLDSESKRQADDAPDVQAWVERALSEEDSCVLFYKPKDSVCPQFEQLRDDDFMLVIMTPGQREMLLKYGSDVVCVDSHGTNGYEVTTIFVLDELRPGFPCAFLITNRTDHVGVEIFLTLVKEKVGAIEASVIMSDVSELFYNSWEKVMGDCERRLFCVWHVLRAWHYKINAVTENPDKRKRASDAMNSLLYETDQQTFNQMFHFLVDSLCTDEDTSEFGTYIKQYYGKNWENWAFCYRVNSGINTSLATLHGDFNRISSKRLDLTLNALMRFTDKKLFDRLATLEKGNITCKIEELRKRHQISLGIALTRVVPYPRGNGWSVASGNNRCKVFTVSREDSPCPTEPCNLECRHCQCCVHKFSCTCIDFSIKSNLCKHIHLVCRYISHQTKKKTSENQKSPTDQSNSDDEGSDSQGFQMDEDDYTEETSQLVPTSPQKRDTSCPESDEDLEKQMLDTLLSIIDTCQTREHLLCAKRILDSIQPIINASIQSSSKNSLS